MDTDPPPGSANDPTRPIEVSIIVPIGPGDDAWRDLLGDLRELPFTAEILCVAAESAPTSLAQDSSIAARIDEWMVSQPGRATQMNVGANRARGRFLWFLHADSRVTPRALHALTNALASHPQALHYFNLAFGADGPWLMWLNAWGAWWRSHVWGMPFGDQGFCLEKTSFERLGGYPEAACYGEDHLLVWMARRRGIRLRCTGEFLLTSARKYREHGWVRTTARYAWLTWHQAWPQFWLWLRGR